jgi:hypothetical protein
MLTLTKEKFDAHLKELDKAIEQAKIVLSTTNQPGSPPISRTLS